MYISKELIFKIIYIAIAIIHIVLYLILFYKLHKLKGGKAPTLETFKSKVIELGKALLSPNNSIITGLLEFIHNQSSNSDTDDDQEEGGENG